MSHELSITGILRIMYADDIPTQWHLKVTLVMQSSMIVLGRPVKTSFLAALYVSSLRLNVACPSSTYINIQISFLMMEGTFISLKLSTNINSPLLKTIRLCRSLLLKFAFLTTILIFALELFVQKYHKNETQSVLYVKKSVLIAVLVPVWNTFPNYFITLL